jgi:AcrR family transcriptional regulator
VARVVKKPDERKDELLEIAIKIFMEKGYENTSIKDIYAEANGSIGMFYHHFGSKEEIFEAAMDKYTDLFVEKVAEILLNKEIPYTERYRMVLYHWMGLVNDRGRVSGTQHDMNVFRVLSGKMLSGSINPAKLYIDEGVEKGLVKTNNSRQSAIVLIYGIFGLIHEERNNNNLDNESALSIFSGVSKIISLLLDADESYFSFAEKE